MLHLLVFFFTSLISALILKSLGHLLHLGLACYCFCKFLSYIIKSFICALSYFLMQALRTINFPLRTAFLFVFLFSICLRNLIVLSFHFHLVLEIF